MSVSYAPPTLDTSKVQYDETDGRLETYDSSRTKWLSVARPTLEFGRSSILGGINAYLLVGDAALNSATGIRLPRNGTIVSATVENDSTVTRNVTLRINDSTVATLALSAAKGVTDNTLDQDFNADDLLQVRAEAAVGNNLNNVVVIVTVAWR